MASKVYLQMEVAEGSLPVFAGLSLADQASIRDGFQDKLFGSNASAVKSLLAGPSFNPSISTDPATGLATLRNRYNAARTAATDYNALRTGMEILLPAAGANGEPPQPQSTYLIWRNGEWVLVTDWEGQLVEGGSNRLTRNLAADATPQIGVVVLATMHVSVEVPVAFP